jgi:hypothetical protein
MHTTAEDCVWQNIDPDLIWVMDKLIVSRKMRYNCGPVGLDVPHPGFYIVRPCVNMLGLGLGAKKMWLKKDTCNLPYGYFWCEWFEGRHLSVDYFYGKQELCVEGHKKEDTFTQWDHWTRTDDVIPFPKMLHSISHPHKWINCEFIGGKLIEVHLRRNEDFDEHTEHFIPVWTGQDTTPPEGYTYRDYPDVHGRIGAFVK